ncbi:MAG TPA: UDP-N-acetylmuramate:L-alanyl-gamma-D-glutamyl-meso-diaminopimelate ligase [Gammaproteobacteria bacterium]|nr:UDP-N-acetylmuramate:L-alanyl-gamma-D-glutamyl-meso-diaminopimelate ligase [Gammaproteobacteria bacterium]
MHIHILGICGTFMGGIALLAREAGFTVSGSDANVYPPMSTQLEAQGITLCEGYDPAHLRPKPDCVVIGNALSRGNAAVEYVLNEGLPYTSGPQWLAEHILKDKWVLAVAGTHGKTTTSSMLAWILEYAGLAPGFLIGGVPNNFGLSARLGQTPFFVVEADEYDTAFFDKRSKFVHYRPRTAILNNLEFDHADIFADLAAIELQFHYLVRTVPGTGLIVANGYEESIQRVLQRGCWSPVEWLGRADGWQAAPGAQAGIAISFQGQPQGILAWDLLGEHNLHNALAAIAAARHVGVPPAQAVAALAEFRNVKRRMEVRGVVNGITVYDDFAHHPTAITTTLQGLRAKLASVPGSRILAVLEPRSNTMRMGVHQQTLAPALSLADGVALYEPANLGWSLAGVAQQIGPKARVFASTGEITQYIAQQARPGDHVLIMSNGSFDGLHEQVVKALNNN